MKKINLIVAIFFAMFIFINNASANSITDQGYGVTLNGKQFYGVAPNYSKVVTLDPNSPVTVGIYAMFHTDNNIIGQDLLFKTSICTGMPNYLGVTSNASFSGSFKFVKQVSHKNSGTCKINGNSAILFEDIYVFNVLELNALDTGGYWGEANFNLFGGNYSPNYVSGWQMLSAQLIDYDESVISNAEIVSGQDKINNTLNDTNNKLNGVNDKLNDTNNKLNDVNNSLNNDDIDASGANSFFSGFSDTDHGGISAVVTAPLKLLQSMTNTCEPLYMDVLGADVELPCGDTLFWGREDVKTFRNTWNILVGGVLIYSLMLKLFQVIQNLKDPESDKVEVMKL